MLIRTKSLRSYYFNFASEFRFVQGLTKFTLFGPDDIIALLLFYCVVEGKKEPNVIIRQSVRDSVLVQNGRVDKTARNVLRKIDAQCTTG